MERAEDNCLVSAVIARYFHHLDREGRGATLHLARTMLDPAIAEFGHVRVKELRPIAVTDWLAKMADERRRKGKQKPWNQTTRGTAARVLNRAFNWAKEQGVLVRNPIAGLAKPEQLVRGKEVVLPEQLQNVLIASANPELAKFLKMLRGTGARPGEIIHAECRHYRPDLEALIFPWNPPPGEWRWKNAKKVKRDRVIYLTAELRQLVEQEVQVRKGTGRVSMTARRRRWTNPNLTGLVLSLAKHKDVRAWCEENSFDAGKIMAYSFRHSYITRMLTAGCPIKLLADWTGTSVLMIEKAYSHAHDDHAAMRRLHDQFSAAAASSPPAP
jgi:integrase